MINELRKDKCFAIFGEGDTWPYEGVMNRSNIPEYPSFFLEGNKLLFWRLGFHITSLSKESATSSPYNNSRFALIP